LARYNCSSMMILLRSLKCNVHRRRTTGQSSTACRCSITRNIWNLWKFAKPRDKKYGQVVLLYLQFNVIYTKTFFVRSRVITTYCRSLVDPKYRRESWPYCWDCIAKNWPAKTDNGDYWYNLDINYNVCVTYSILI